TRSPTCASPPSTGSSRTSTSSWTRSRDSSRKARRPRRASPLPSPPPESNAGSSRAEHAHLDRLSLHAYGRQRSEDDLALEPGSRGVAHQDLGAQFLVEALDAGSQSDRVANQDGARPVPAPDAPRQHGPPAGAAD